MTAPLTTAFGPCAPWPARWTCDVSCESPTVTAQAVQVATEVVWALSGRQFGLCTVTLRPCRRECQDFPWPLTSEPWSWAGQQWLSPALIGGQWFNQVCGRCVQGCSCSSLSEVVLPAPVHRIVEVKVDGVPLVTGSYRLDDNRTAVRTDGTEWPRCQDLEAPDTATDTWSITAEYGTAVPEGGAWAVGELACQLLRAARGEDCRLPAGVTQLVRQGVTIDFPDVVELFDKGVTGLYLVDLFVRTWNPGKLKRRSGVYSVDRALHRRVAT